MSGGSWDYVYRHVEEAAEKMLEEKDPVRVAFGKHLVKVAFALHEVEWVDSCDRVPPDDTDAIMEVLKMETIAATAVLELQASMKAVIDLLTPKECDSCGRMKCIHCEEEHP